MRLPWSSGYITLAASSDQRSSTDLDSEECNGFLREKDQTSYEAVVVLHKWKRLLILGTLVNIVILMASSALFLSWAVERLKTNPVLRQSQYYSPLIDMVDLELHTEKVNGTLFPSENPSVARQMPNEAAEAIWDEWEWTRSIPITAEQVKALGKDPKTVAKFDDDYWHLGDDAYMAQFDVFHQLHCLNTLRKLIYPDHYGPGGEGNKTHSERHSKMWYIHMNHCVDILMQAIQCSGNVNFYTMQWMETQSHPFPDFSVNRKCINFEKLVDFRIEHTVDLQKWTGMKKPEGIKQVPAPDAYYEVMGIPNPNAEGLLVDKSVYINT